MRERFLLVLATLAIYWNALYAGLPFDAVALVKEDVRIQSWTWPHFLGILGQNYWGTRFQSGLYRPLVTLSYLLQHGSKPWAYHAVNLVLHLVVLLLVFELFRRISMTRWSAFLAALIWAVHPMNVDAVTNVAGRPDEMAAIFLLSGFLVASKSDPTAPRLLLIGALAFFGMMSKESAIVLVPLVLFWFWWSIEEFQPKALKAAAWGVAIALVIRECLSIDAGMQKPFVDNPIVGFGFWQGKFTAVKALAFMLWNWFVDWRHISPDYSFNEIPVWSGREWWVVLFGLGLLVLSIWAFFDQKKWAFLFCFTFLTLLPASNLLITSGSIAAARFWYLPGVGLAGLCGLAVQWALEMRFRRPEWAFAAGCYLVVHFALGPIETIALSQAYGEDVRFWQRAAGRSPNSFKPHVQLAVELWRRGRQVEAIQEVSEARRILDPLPDSQKPYEPYSEFFGYYQGIGDQQNAKAMAWQVARIFDAQSGTQKIAEGHR